MNNPSEKTQIDPDFLKTLSVLYVEDDEEIRELLSRFLHRRVGTLHTATNGQEGAQAFLEHHPDVVVTDIKMPVMDGLEMAAVIKSSSHEVPIIVITAYSERDYFIRAIEIGVDQYVTKPVNTDTLLQAIYKSARHRLHQLEMEKAEKLVVDALEQTIGVLSRAIELRDPYTDGHQKRVALLATAIAEEMGMPADTVTGIRLGSLVHDVGKIRVPSEILSCPRKLTGNEMNFIRTHPDAGYEIVDGASFPWPVARMVFEHHERMDGSGYPKGLKGDEICMEARIIAVADVVEAMNSFRPYRPALGIEAAMAEIRRGRGTIYDPDVVDGCLRALEKADFKFWDRD
ncbi:MAG: response regulator [Nitrosomonadales bacterium]|nr:response regulator [Nitrosomonadales bacterium]